MIAEKTALGTGVIDDLSRLSAGSVAQREGEDIQDRRLLVEGGDELGEQYPYPADLTVMPQPEQLAGDRLDGGDTHPFCQTGIFGDHLDIGAVGIFFNRLASDCDDLCALKIGLFSGEPEDIGVVAAASPRSPAMMIYSAGLSLGARL